MSCQQIEPELIGYHFGVIDDDTRQQIEKHLLGCAGCLRSFLALKRDLETAASSPRPSAALHARLRQDVAAELGLAPRPWRWWERPLVFACAGAAVIVAVLAVGSLATSPGHLPHALREAPVSAPAPVPAPAP